MDPTSQTSSGALATMSIRFCAGPSPPTSQSSNRQSSIAADRSNAEWRRDLAVSHGKLGDALVRQGKLAEALAAYRDHLGIAERLAAADRSNAEWQNDLAIGIGRIGAMS